MDGPLTADDGYWFGLGAFETIRVYRGKAVFLEEHLRRLQKAADFFGLLRAGEKDGCWLDARREQVRRFLQENPMENGACKLTVSEKNILLTSRLNVYTEEQYEKGFHLEYSSIRRNETSPFTYYKTLNCGENILEKRRAVTEGYDEPVFLNTRGEICEGAATNLFFVEEGRIITPPVACGLLNGILRQFIMGLRPVEERVIRPEMVEHFQEMFITNSLLGVMPVSRLGEKQFTSRSCWKSLCRQVFCEQATTKATEAPETFVTAKPKG